jgi:prepilin-type N-terminal cleavage/methylation domain-containing protein
MKYTDSTKASHTPMNAARGLEKSRKRAGMTLVETIVALAIFAVFTTGACKLFMSHRRLSDMARGHYTAINIAKNRLELARTVDFGQLASYAESNVVVNVSGEPDTEGHYRRTTDISNFSGNLVEIAIKVDLRNRRTLDFTPANEQLTSYIANYLKSQEL